MLTARHFASCLESEPRFTSMWRALEFAKKNLRWRHSSGKPTQVCNETEMKEYFNWRDSALRHINQLSPTNSITSSWLKGEVIFSKTSLREIYAISPETYDFFQDSFWHTCRTLPTSAIDYSDALPRFSSLVDDWRLCDKIRFGYFSQAHRRPPYELVLSAAAADDLTGLEFFVLLHGASRELAWLDLQRLSFECLVRKLSRMSVLPPLDSIGEDFYRYLLNSLEPMMDWESNFIFRKRLFKKLLEYAHEDEILALDIGTFGAKIFDEVGASRLINYFESKEHVSIEKRDTALLEMSFFKNYLKSETIKDEAQDFFYSNYSLSEELELII